LPAGRDRHRSPPARPPDERRSFRLSHSGAWLRPRRGKYAERETPFDVLGPVRSHLRVEFADRLAILCEHTHEQIDAALLDDDAGVLARFERHIVPMLLSACDVARDRTAR